MSSRDLAGVLSALLIGCGGGGDGPRVDGAGGGDGASADARVIGDGGGAGFDGPRGTGPAEFTYVEVPGMVCANGTPAGIGVSDWASDTLVLFVNGGGACWDPNTCFVLRSATHIDTTYSAAVLAADVAPLTASGLTDRAAVDNPLATAAFAFVPYCTADFHSGDATRPIQVDILGNTRDVHFRGRPNLRAATAALAARMPGLRQIHLIGASAGGFGAMLGVDVVEQAFPAARVDLLADGSPTLQPAEYATWRSVWNMTAADCTTCDQTFANLPAHLAASRQGRRLGLITTTNDGVIRAFFGFGLGDITPQVGALIDTHYAQAPAHAFVVTGTEHVLLGGYRTLVGPGGVTLKSWFDDWVAGAPGWTTVRP
ncbi:MAG: hypothetical protein KBG28_10250 [Kofleriaceae bacterium]|jgi:hypothetical protein|nr:hypothetical protein [Kofleriaceae bacterium]MBP6841562.1 hypothetical protein [Kofleriaceae bacterium]MBP9204335.1 hypothetical protein [Kofleriaceae bacterium]